MNLVQIKELSLKAWQYHIDHPEDDKDRLMPEELKYYAHDVFCQLYKKPSCICPDCPIGSCYDGLIGEWALASCCDISSTGYDRTRKAAQGI